MSLPISFEQSSEAVSPLTTLVNANTSNNNRMANLGSQGLSSYTANYTAVNAMVISLPKPFPVTNRTADLDVSTLVDITRQLNSYLVKWYKLVLPYILKIRADSGSATFTTENPSATFSDIVSAAGDATVRTWLETLMSNLDVNYPSWSTSLALLNTTIDYNDQVTTLTTDMDLLDPSSITREVVKTNSMGLSRIVYNTVTNANTVLPNATYPVVRNIGTIADTVPTANVIVICPVENPLVPSTGKKIICRVAISSANITYIGATFSGFPLLQGFPAGKYRMRLMFGGGATYIRSRSTEGPVYVNNGVTIPGPILLPQVDAQANYLDLPDCVDLAGVKGGALSWLTTDASTIATITAVGLDFVEYEVDTKGNVNGIQNLVAFYMPVLVPPGGAAAISFVFEAEILEEYNVSAKLGSLVGLTGWTNTGFSVIRNRHNNEALKFLRWVDTYERRDSVSKAVVAALTAGFTNLSSAYTISPGSMSYVTMSDSSAFVGMGQALISEAFWFGPSTTPVNGANNTTITALSPDDKKALYCIWYTTLNRCLFDLIGDLSLLQTYAGSDLC